MKVSQKSVDSEAAVAGDRGVIATAVGRAFEASPSTPFVSQVSNILEAAIEEGRRAWPTLSVPPEAFVAQVMRSLCGEEEIRGALSNLRAADAYLAAACAQGIPAALGAFEAAYFGEIPRLVSAAAADPDLRGEVQQVLREKLFLFSTRSNRPPEIAKYGGRGSLRNWFRIVVVHHTINLKRKERRTSLTALLDHDVASDSSDGGHRSDPEIAYLRERYSLEFRAALDHALSELSAEDRRHLVYYYVERLTIDQVGTLHGIHRVTAARRINRARDRLVCAIREALRLRLGVGPTELESIFRLLPSQLPLSLSRRLKV